LKCVYSIDDLNTRSSQFNIKMEKGARGHEDKIAERESEGKRERV
jgi:hypothetical protein